MRIYKVLGLFYKSLYQTKIQAFRTHDSRNQEKFLHKSSCGLPRWSQKGKWKTLRREVLR